MDHGGWLDRPVGAGYRRAGEHTVLEACRRASGEAPGTFSGDKRGRPPELMQKIVDQTKGSSGGSIDLDPNIWGYGVGGPGGDQYPNALHR